MKVTKTCTQSCNDRPQANYRTHLSQYTYIYSIPLLKSPTLHRAHASCRTMHQFLQLRVSYMLIITIPFCSPLHPHLLEVLDNHHVGIHVAVDTVLHASVFASGKSALRHAAGDALLEADGVEFVDGCGAALVCGNALKYRYAQILLRRIYANMEIWTYWTEPGPSGSRRQ
jgi:hypothetical protein